MTRTEYKALSSQLRANLFDGEFHTAGTVLIVKHNQGISCLSLARRCMIAPRLIDVAWMTKGSRRVMLSTARKAAPLPLPR
jgi:hypothetical protein